MKKYFSAIFCLSMFFHPFCAIAQIEDAKRMSELIEEQVFLVESDIARKLFFTYAKAGDVEKMIEATSPTTRKEIGESETSRIYKEAYVPLFRRYDEQPKSCEEKPVKKTDGALGWRFICRLTNKNKEQIFVVIWIVDEGKKYVDSMYFADSH